LIFWAFSLATGRGKTVQSVQQTVTIQSQDKEKEEEQSTS
jgi:hypothetical protein